MKRNSDRWTVGLISAWKFFTGSWFRQGVPDLKLKFPPVFAELKCQGNAEWNDSVCAYRLHGTGRGAYGKEMVCSCVSAWSHSAQLWLSEKVRFWSSPCQIHTCCPRIGSESKISCASIPKMLDVAENVPLRWSFGVGTELGVRQEWRVKDWSSYTEGLLRYYQMDSKGVSTQRQLARPWRESQGLKRRPGISSHGWELWAEANARNTPPRGLLRKRSRKPRGALIKASMWNPSKGTRSLPALGDRPVAGPIRDLYFYQVLDGFCVAAFTTTN